jgi:hypothetical protein
VATQVLFLTVRAKLTQVIYCVNQHNSRENRNDENLNKVENNVLMYISLMPGLREKGTEKKFKYSYPEPTQVPLGEKPKV